jgi:NurA-like 5'-3' nuclease
MAKEKASTEKSNQENLLILSKERQRASIKQDGDRVVISIDRDEAIDLLHTLRNVDHYKNSSYFGSDFSILLRRFFVENKNVEDARYSFFYERADD